jgi:hypothetical protein
LKTPFGNVLKAFYQGFMNYIHCMHQAFVLQMHLQPPFTWFKKIFRERVPGGASECPAAMPSMGTSLAWEH